MPFVMNCFVEIQTLQAIRWSIKK